MLVTGLHLIFSDLLAVVPLFEVTITITALIPEQGRIHGNPVADGWAGAVLRKSVDIQIFDRRMDGRTDKAGC